MGKAKNREMLIWTREEYEKFSFAVMDKPLSFYAFEMLYPGNCGLDFGKIIQTFHDVGYDDLFCTEVFQYPDMEECARRAIAYLAPIFEKVYGRRPRA